MNPKFRITIGLIKLARDIAPWYAWHKAYFDILNRFGATP